MSLSVFSIPLKKKITFCKEVRRKRDLPKRAYVLPKNWDGGCSHYNFLSVLVFWILQQALIRSLNRSTLQAVSAHLFSDKTVTAASNVSATKFRSPIHTLRWGIHRSYVWAQPTFCAFADRVVVKAYPGSSIFFKCCRAAQTQNH